MVPKRVFWGSLYMLRFIFQTILKIFRLPGYVIFLQSKQQIPISKSFVLPDQISNYHTQGKHYTTDIVQKPIDLVR
jgi:hypothetical protein